jgi:hypothetical protein
MVVSIHSPRPCVKPRDERFRAKVVMAHNVNCAGGDVQAASQHFVAIVRGDAIVATFLPYSQHFVARAIGAVPICDEILPP